MPTKTRPCEVCNKLIEPERVEVIPETRLCAEHAAMIARHGGEFTLTTTQESLGKTESLKKNYGSVTPEMKRNKKALEALRRETPERPARSASSGRGVGSSSRPGKREARTESRPVSAGDGIL